MNKYKEYIYNHDIKDTAIKVCSEYYMNKVFTNNEYCKNNIDYHYYYDITDKDYIVEINDYEAFLEYLKDNNITHDRGYVSFLGDSVNITCKTNRVHDKIIRKMFNVY